VSHDDVLRENARLRHALKSADRWEAYLAGISSARGIIFMLDILDEPIRTLICDALLREIMALELRP
jgi:hypothetical protein